MLAMWMVNELSPKQSEVLYRFKSWDLCVGLNNPFIGGEGDWIKETSIWGVEDLIFLIGYLQTKLWSQIKSCVSNRLKSYLNAMQYVVLILHGWVRYLDTRKLYIVCGIYCHLLYEIVQCWRNIMANVSFHQIKMFIFYDALKSNLTFLW